MSELLARHAYQVSMLIVVVTAINWLTPRRFVHFRFVLWVGVLVKCLVPPIWVASWGPFCDRVSPEPYMAETSQTITYSIEGSVIDDNTVAANPILDEREIASGVASTPRLDGRFSWLAPWSLRRRLLIAWFTVAALMLTCLFTRAIRCLRNATRTATPPPHWLRAEFERLRVDIVPKIRVRILVTKANVGPALAGILRPRVILPQVIVEQCSRQDVTTILAHELMHVRRGDVWISLFETIARSIWWFHPLVRWACFVIGREAERCCDAEVIASQGISPARYARALLAVLEQRSQMVAVPVCPGVRPFDLTSQRMERIMKMKNGIKRGWWWKPGLVLIAMLIVPGGRLLSEPPQAEPIFSNPPKKIETLPPKPGLVLNLTPGAALIGDEEEEIVYVGPSTLVTPYNLKKPLKKLIKTAQLSKEDAQQLVVKRLLEYAPAVKSAKWDGNTLVVSAQNVEPSVMDQWVLRSVDPELIVLRLRMTVIEGAREDILGLVDNWEKAQAAEMPVDDKDQLPEEVIRSERKVPLSLREISKEGLDEFSGRLGKLRGRVISRPYIQILDGQAGRIVSGSIMQFTKQVGNAKLETVNIEEGLKVDILPTIREDQHVGIGVTSSEVVSMENRTVRLQEGNTFSYNIPEMTLTRVSANLKMDQRTGRSGHRTFVLAGKLHTKRTVGPNTPCYTAIVVQLASAGSFEDFRELAQPQGLQGRQAANVQGVPIFGDVPYLGRFFRNTQTSAAPNEKRVK